ncbi:MAG: hypothetical protein B2I17_08720 [Thermoplasmatales archaeon B_DKE]|nr:MAG: hypothetical protein B2I17_08720 [Thermoplasmatales archaeon B_DKE]
MFCDKCGAQIPDDAVFCPKCGNKVGSLTSNGNAAQGATAKNNDRPVIASPDIQALKCPSCGAPLKPELGEMIITCEYCGASITLNSDGWRNVGKHSMLTLKIVDTDSLTTILKEYLDKGLLRKHLEEDSKNEGMNLAYIPYWVVPVSARTQYSAISAASEVGTIAGSALLMGLMGGAMGGGRGRGGGFGMMEGAMMGGMMMGGMGRGNGNLRAYTLDQNYDYPIVAMKGMLGYQPKDYSFDLKSRVIFDVSKIPKGIKVLNGDVSEESAKYEAKTYVDQLQSKKVHDQHHMVQKITTEDDVSEPELLHVPVWFAKFSHKGKDISLVIDASSSRIINSIGLE